MLTSKAHVETKELASFLGPFSQGVEMSGNKEVAAKLARAAYWLDRLSRDVCGAGYIGCRGGPNCDSDHK